VVNLYLNQNRVGDITVLDLKGRNRIGAGIELHRAIRCLVDEGKNQILLNLSGVIHIDSCGLGELISSAITVRNRGGIIKFAHIAEPLYEVMNISNILSAFDVYEDETSAMASFSDQKAGSQTVLRLEKAV
jgi:anti-sigma B factor antagonist